MATEAPDPFDLRRFLVSQEPVYATVLAELRAGEKRSHWMWYIFPQLDGLGISVMAAHYGIRSLEEARAYDRHPVLGQRLRECFRLVIASGRPIASIFASPDHLKYRSCATLFAQAVPQEALYAEALRQGFNGEPDTQTLRLLSREPASP